VASDVADSVVAKITGGTIRGRRVVARIDQERPGRGGASRSGRSGTDRGDRPQGGLSRREGGFRREGGRGGPRGRERGNRGDRGDRGSSAPDRRTEDRESDRAARPPQAEDQE
jgi:hypothetical protein